MPGYCIVHGRCFGCGQLFQFHPHKVPSIRVEGVRQPVCRTCIEKANPERIKNGLAPVVIMDGAYEPCPEEEL